MSLFGRQPVALFLHDARGAAGALPLVPPRARHPGADTAAVADFPAGLEKGTGLENRRLGKGAENILRLLKSG